MAHQLKDVLLNNAHTLPLDDSNVIEIFKIIHERCMDDCCNHANTIRTFSIKFPQYDQQVVLQVSQSIDYLKLRGQGSSNNKASFSGAVSLVVFIGLMFAVVNIFTTKEPPQRTPEQVEYDECSKALMTISEATGKPLTATDFQVTCSPQFKKAREEKEELQRRYQ